jgi:hypothetical protein
MVTVILFAMISHGMDSYKFAEFGYWWSLGVMIGGVLMGGLGAALVRIATTYGSLRHLVAPLMRIGASFALLLAVLLGGISADVDSSSTRIALAVMLFGLSMLAQTAVMGLLRAVEATRANIIASALMLIVVPTTVLALIDVERALPKIFIVLAVAFAVGTAVAFIIGRTSLSQLLIRGNAAVAPSSFSRHALAFTATNVFSYAVMNIDFTLFRLIGSPDEFVSMAGGKVFFERFVVPALSVFVGAVTLRVLRHPPTERQARLDIKLSLIAVMCLIALVALLSFGYWIFMHFVRFETDAMELQWVAAASVGYVLYSLNSILLDLLVIRYNMFVVVLHTACFILLAGVIQTTTIRLFGLPGWSLGWLAFNLCVTVTLWRRDLFSLSWIATASRF